MHQVSNTVTGSVSSGTEGAQMKGLISQTLDWVTHPSYSDGNLMDWAAGLVLILIAAFLWSQVLRQIE